jgi:hypothetical protein
MDRAGWVKNARRQPEVTVKIRERVLVGQARQVSDPTEDALARQLIEGKYSESEEDLDEWLKSALPVAVDFVA